MSSVWLSPEEAARAIGYLDETFGIRPGVFAEHKLLRRAEYVFAVRREAADACEALRWVSSGLKILQVTGSGGFRPATRGVQVFGRWATRRVCDLREADLRDLLAGRSVPWEGDTGLVILRHKGVPVGTGVVRGDRLVSQLPRSMTEHLRLSPGGTVL